ncbi:beta-galactosidase, partial [Trifolium medium]|nr:beta-galactosidase [Trifolium medium]
MINSQRVYVFLAGLDSHLDGVRGRILATTPLPNVQSVYATVYAEANRQEAMLGNESTEGSIFAVKKYPKKGV